MFVPLCVLLGMTVTLSGLAVAEETPLRFLTEQNPPATFLVDGKAKGATIELLAVLQQRLNEPGKTELMPWARALATAQENPSTVLFETVRTEPREHEFKWVGPVQHYQVFLTGLRSELKSKLPTALRVPGDFVACSYRHSASAADMKRLGFQENVNLVYTTTPGECLQMLLLDRVQLIAVTELNAETFRQQAAAAGQELQQLMVLGERKRYLAFSPDVDDKRIARWQQALMQSYRDGTMRRIYQPFYPEAVIQRLEQFAASAP